LARNRISFSVEVDAMNGTAFLLFSAAAGMIVSALPAEAQERRTAERPLVLRVTPRSFLDPGPVVPVGSLDRTTSGYAQTQSYLMNPSYAQNGERFGGGALPDPITNGPYVGSRNAFAPADAAAPSRPNR
jgi:hypothetical protein